MKAEITKATGGAGFVTASCDAGSVLTGGGAALTGGNNLTSTTVVRVSAPVGSPPTGWEVRTEQRGAGLIYTLTAYAVCVP